MWHHFWLYSEMPCSKLFQDSDCRDWSFLWFSSASAGKYRDSTLSELTNASFHIPSNTLITLIQSFNAIGGPETCIMRLSVLIIGIVTAAAGTTTTKTIGTGVRKSV
jgi:hypothetical protein